MKKFVGWSLLLIVCAALAWFAYQWYSARGKTINGFSLIPEDAIYVLETDQPLEAWKTIAATETWKHLQGNAWFASLTSSANSLDSLLQKQPQLFDLIGKRNVLFSTHLSSPTSFDFLIVADLGEASGIKFMESYLSTISFKGYQFSKEKIQETDCIRMYNTSDKSTMYMALVETYLIVSFNKSLLEKSILAKNQTNLSQLPSMKLASESVGRSGFARVYLNYTQLHDYLALYMGPNEYNRYFSEHLTLGSMYLEEKNERLNLIGSAWLKDSSVSYFSAMLNSGKGPTECEEIAPERTAFYLGLGFTSFQTYYNAMLDNLKKDLSAYDEYMSNIRKTEKFLNISIEKDFVSWIDDEVALLELTSAGEGLDNEMALVLKAGNIEKAKDRLEHIEKMIRKRTPVKFKSIDYQGYRISYLSIKGLFKVLLGKFFARYDKPYYTILNNYIIFSNHPQTLESIIDDYLAKRTLARSESYRNFRSGFANQGAVFAYLNTPSLFSSLKNIATRDTRLSMDSNKAYIQCFRHVGFQLIPSQQKLDVMLSEQFELAKKEVPSLADTLQVSDSLEALFKLPYIYVKDPNAREYKEYYEDSSSIKLVVELKYGFKDGHFTEYYPSGEVKLKGKFKKDRRSGTWKAFSEQGELLGKFDFD
ncbi:MAG: DUF3352 domain-containing protein [Cytophagaceae bacterium]|nr:DUF3352 domain-containing protein [Cytophagaceae bacterium]